MNKTSRIFVIALALFLLIAFSSAFFLFLINLSSRKKLLSEEAPQKTPLSVGLLAPGINRYLDFQRRHSDIIMGASIEVRLRGIITSIGPNTVGLKSGDEQLILQNEEEGRKTSYLINATDKTRQPTQVTYNDFRVGNGVDVLLTIDLTNGKQGIKLVVRSE